MDKRILALVVVILIITAYFLLFNKPSVLASTCGDRVCGKGEEKTCPQDCNATPSANGKPPGVIPVGDILISMRVDDPYFGEGERPFLETIVLLAREYNVKFDLGVIAWPFDHLSSPDVFSIYQDNTDVLEIAAHGYRHIQVPEWTYGWDANYDIIVPMDDQLDGYGPYANHNEFGSGGMLIVPRATQDALIQNMSEVFARHNITAGTEIFFTPFFNGDNNTIDLASEHGYKYLAACVEATLGAPMCKYGDMIVTSGSAVPGPSIQGIERLLDQGYRHIVVIFHPSDFVPQRVAELRDDFFSKLSTSRYYSKMRFGFISEAIVGNYYDGLAQCPERVSPKSPSGGKPVDGYAVPEYGKPQQGTCGDGICAIDPPEKETCPQDCGQPTK